MKKFFGIVDVNGDLYQFADGEKFVSVSKIGSEEDAEKVANIICNICNTFPVNEELKPYKVVAYERRNEHHA